VWHAEALLAADALCHPPQAAGEEALPDENEGGVARRHASENEPGPFFILFHPERVARVLWTWVRDSSSQATSFAGAEPNPRPQGMTLLPPGFCLLPQLPNEATVRRDGLNSLL
jgi:hypothetical protein